MLSKQEFLDSLIKANPNYDTERIGKAFDLGLKKHEKQLRKSGEPYFIHPIAVAQILVELGMDDETIMAGLLHDVVEDTDYTSEELEKDFGASVRLLVDGVTKLTSLKLESKETQQSENLRKMFLAMSKDIRVLIIKLADRLHNLRTIDYMTEAKMVEKCSETLDIYAPLAGRLGISTVKIELEDIALAHLHPDEYKDLVKQVDIKKEERLTVINTVMAQISDELEKLEINFTIKGRSKHLYSIYKKMIYQHKQLDEIFDLTAVRVITESVQDCYAVLGVVHTMWKPIPGRFKDYVAMPKPNMYQSIHTTVIGDNGDPFEIQIRTREMDKIAEYGIAAHWKYKEGKTQSNGENEEVKLAWLRQTLELQKDMKDPAEFLESLKMDLFASQVFVFTPRGEVIELPSGSTPLDFAFKIHSAVGYKCIGAKINAKMVPIDYELQNGDIVEIVTSANSSGPSADWLQIAKSSSARAKIRAWLKKENKDDNVEKGKELIDKCIRRKGLDTQLILKNTYISKAAKELGINSANELYSQLSHGGAFMSKVVNMLISYYKADYETPQEVSLESIVRISPEEKKKKESKLHSAGIRVDGQDSMLVHFARCCNPVPGDRIIGYITKGNGVSVHRADCINIKSLPPEEEGRFIEVTWDEANLSKNYDADISIIASDRKGLLTDFSRICEDMNISISGVNAKSGKDGEAHIVMTLSITNTSQMDRILRSFNAIPGIISVYRNS